MLGIYCRISKKKTEGKDTSIQTQRESGISFAMKNSLHYNLYIDTGITGQKQADERDGLENLLNDIEKGIITSVWVYDQSRFERNEILWFDFQTMIIEYKIDFYIGGVLFDISNEDMRLMANMMSAINASFARRTGKKVKKSYAQRFSDGKWVGITPYGYTTDSNGRLIIHKDQAEVVMRIFNESLNGIGAYTIANLLNDDDIPTKSADFKGGVIRNKDPYTKTVKKVERDYIKWRGNVVSGIIRNRIYKGKWILNEGKNDEMERESPIIIPPYLYDKVIGNLASNRKNVGKRETYEYLVNGLVFCLNCGKEMRGKKRIKGKDSAYKCAGGKDCRGMNIAKLETFIINHLFLSKNLQQMLANSPKAGNEILSNLSAQLGKHQTELRKCDSKIKRLLAMEDDEELIGDSEIIEEYKKSKKRKQELEKKVEVLEKEIFSIKNDIPTTRLNNVINDFKLDMGFDKIKKSVHALIERIEVSYNAASKDFVMRIKYAGFDEYAIFKVDIALLNWNWLMYEREKAYTAEQLKNDRKEFAGYMQETFGILQDASEQWQGGLTEPRFGQIILEKGRLIEFI